MRFIESTWTRMLAAGLMGTVIAGEVRGDEIADAAAEQSMAERFSFEIGGDFTTEYWFRGIGQENHGVIFQPWANIGVDLFTTDEGYNVAGYIGTWNSLHDQYSDGVWFERDLYFGFTLTTPGGHALDISYVNLASPASDITFAEEIDIFFSIDDTEFAEDLGIPALAPYIGVVFETSGGSDAGANEGTYLELGIEPSFTLCEDTELDLSIPVTFGFSIDDYYEDGMGNDDFFGYADVGLVLSFPLGFIPEGFGNWDATAGVHLLVLGDSAENISGAFGTGNDSVATYATFGVSTSF